MEDIVVGGFQAAGAEGAASNADGLSPSSGLTDPPPLVLYSTGSRKKLPRPSAILQALPRHERVEINLQ